MSNLPEMPSEEFIKETIINKIPLGKTFKNHSSKKIFGPPGTGKTFFLLKKVKEYIANGIKPEDIAFISYTNAAANEAKKRVSEVFPNLGSIDFPFFSTMHSLATIIGGDKGRELCLEEHWKAFDKTIFCYDEWTVVNDPFSVVSRFSHPVLDLYSLALSRETSISVELNKKIESGDYYSMKDIYSLKDTLHDYFKVHINGDNMLEYSQRYVDRYIDFKRRESLVDFNDVILNTVDDSFDDNRIPSFEVLIIDEAQDLSNNLWSLAKKLIKKAGTVLIAGDDDQAIMINFGASSHEFLNIKTTKKDTPLPKSFRVPPEIMKYVDAGVMKFIKALPNRQPKDWDSAPHKGNIGKHTTTYIDANNILNHYEEYGINEFLRELIVKKEDNWLIMCPTKNTGALVSNALLEQDPPIPHFYRNRPKPNLETIEIEKEEEEEEEEESSQITRIRIQSVHISKGDQADNVAIVVGGIGDISMLVNDPRLAYVALTRAKYYMIPRVVKKGLLAYMLSRDADLSRLAHQYMRMFPTEI